jgi:hypothetical protein
VLDLNEVCVSVCLYAVRGCHFMRAGSSAADPIMLCSAGLDRGRADGDAADRDAQAGDLQRRGISVIREYVLINIILPLLGQGVLPLDCVDGMLQPKVHADAPCKPTCMVCQSAAAAAAAGGAPDDR